MSSDLNPEDVQEPAAPWNVMVKRGFKKHCPRCGGGKLYRGWFRMVERCPTCGFKFEREPGFFTGAYFINFAVTEGLLFVVVMAYLLIKANNADASVVPPLVVGGVFAVVAPILGYPYARTIWSGIDLAMTPLELDEIVAARDFLDGAQAPAGEGEAPADGGVGKDDDPPPSRRSR